MKRILTTLFILLSSSASAFILISPNSYFRTGKLKINVSSNSCATAGITHDELFEYIDDSLNAYWNQVPTSSLEIEKGSVVSIDIDDATMFTQAENNTIIVGCSTSGSFDASTSYPEGTGNHISSGSKHVGVVYINNVYANGWATGSYDRLFYVMAHEMGHALGLHHSNDPASIMTYNAGYDYPEYLAQDDMDGITYLYPDEKKMGGLLGGCGSVDLNNKGGPQGPLFFVLSLLCGLALAFFRPQAKAKEAS